MALLPVVRPSEISKVACKYFEYKDACLDQLKESQILANISSETHCIGEFDNFVCWPHTRAGSMARVPCPDYVPGGNDTQGAYRYCSNNVTWFTFGDSDKEWSYIEECWDENNGTETEQERDTLLRNLRIMYSVGYGVSLICLIVALVLLVFFKKLHCTRNYIHINLMVSFILRYVVVLVKDCVLDTHYDLAGVIKNGDVDDYEVLRQYCDEEDTTGWVLTRCRLVITLMHYTITANYFWLLAEGLYLQMLLVFVMSENKYFAGFMVFGWGAPWISVLIWVVLRMHFENDGCWDTFSNMQIWWTIRAPIMISILINFCMFINIVRMIVSKLKANNMVRTDRKLRLAKSTLALIPLLGIHYMVFLALTEDVVDTNDPAMQLRLAFELFFSSIQGALISVLYCFLNTEVRVEVRRTWDLWRSHQNLPKGGSTYRKSSTVGSTNHSTQVTLMYSRHSTTASEIPLIDTAQSRKSSNPDMDGKEDTTDHAKSNGVSHHDRNGLRDHAKLNGVITSVLAVTQNGNVTNGDLELCSDDPLLLREN